MFRGLAVIMGAMGETLEALHRLQAVELQLAEIRSQREVIQRRVEVHRRRLLQANDRIEQLSVGSRRKQMDVDALSLDVASREASIIKHREALNNAKTNKEYSTILAAMNAEKADTGKIESQVLERMEEVQSIGNEITQIDEEKKTHTDALALAEEKLAAFDERHKKESNRLTKERKECESGIAPTTLSSFNRVADHLEGEAMAIVGKVHPKRDEYVCTGCNLKISLEIVNILQSRDEIQLCKCCGRILFVESSIAKTS